MGHFWRAQVFKLVPAGYSFGGMPSIEICCARGADATAHNFRRGPPHGSSRCLAESKGSSTTPWDDSVAVGFSDFGFLVWLGRSVAAPYSSVRRAPRRLQLS